MTIKKKLKRKNPINRMDLSDKETEIYDHLMYEINDKLERESEMKYSNKTLIALLKNLKTDLKSENDSLDDVESYLFNIWYTIKSLHSDLIK